MKTTQPYAPDLDLGVDVVIVFGHDASLGSRIRSWLEAGYTVHFGLGASWGAYQDYLYGAWDGEEHTNEIQTDRDQHRVARDDDTYYLCPTPGFAQYLADKAWEAIQHGATGIHLHEPEFWARAGYCDAFREEWEQHYDTPWIAPHVTVDARYRASKLMYRMQLDSLRKTFADLKARCAAAGRDVRLYVGAHSVLNYAHWRLVSPESSLAGLEECDGYIGQVWAGSARTPVVCRGELTECTFESAFLEYGALAGLARASGQRMWFMMDPLEDDPHRTWADYARNWRATLLAALLYPEVWRYEIAPWPERILRGERASGGGNGWTGMPAHYATQFLTLAHALGEMRQDTMEWDTGGPAFGILISDTVMFQREEPNPSDEHLGFLYGVGIPLLRAGMPVHPVQLEFVAEPGFLDPYEVLFLSYEGQKPPSPECHERLRDWVHDGGVLVYVGDDGDAYHHVLEWWNTGELRYASPREHLFETLGLHPEAPPGNQPGTHRVRTGGVVVYRRNPAELAHSADGPEVVLRLARHACRRRNFRYALSDHLVLRRGPYVLAVGLAEHEDLTPATIAGPVVDLLDPELSVLDSVRVAPGDLRVLLRVEDYEGPVDRVLCAAGRAYDQRREGDRFSFTVAGPLGTEGLVRLRLSDKPVDIALPGSRASHDARWHAPSRTLLLRYPNRPEGQRVRIGLP